MILNPVEQSDLPDGNQTLIFRRWEHGVSQQNNAQFIATFTPLSGSPIITDYFVYETPFGWAKLAAFLRNLEPSVFGEQGQVDTDQIQSLLGLEVPVIIWHQPWQGIQRPRIAGYGHTSNGDTAPTQVASPLAPVLTPAASAAKRKAAREKAKQEQE
jgi:hypothetical protein